MTSKRLNIFLTAVSLLGLIGGGCISDAVSNDPADQPVFSTDLVDFSTVFTGEPTAAARLTVYNPGKRAISISSIRFRNPDGPFRLNVDGMLGKEFSDVEIRGGDSIKVFIDCNIPASESSEAWIERGTLEFLTSGQLREVTVEAKAQNVWRLYEEEITEDMSLRSDRPYVVYDSLVVAKGATLNIDPGVQLNFHSGARFVVRGTLVAKGTVERPIIMSGDRHDMMLPDLSYDGLASQWKGLIFAETSEGNRLEYVDLRSTESGIRILPRDPSDQPALVVVNSWIHNSGERLLDAGDGANVECYGSCLSDAAEAVAALGAGNHKFVQCTLANYYLFSAIGESIIYLGVPGDTAAAFENCIVYGMASPLNVSELDASGVYFKNTLIGADGTDDVHFSGCIWNKDPLFYTDREKYEFNYRLRPGSPAIGAGNPVFVTEICAFDMDGLRRMETGAPTLGAYVFSPPE